MARMDKTFLVNQLADKLRQTLAVTEREMAAAADAAQGVEDPRERRDDGRMAIEYSALARGQARRAEGTRAMLAELETFRPGPIKRGGRIGLGALVEVEDDEDGTGRTFFLAPVGAGIELDGPGGDGFFAVVTPGSPLGRAVLGQAEGDSVDVTVDGTTRSWTITWVA
jgi:transcription elongation GreA/GreB family factor